MRQRIRDKIKKAAAKPKSQGGRPSSNPASYEKAMPRKAAGEKKWLKYRSDAGGNRTGISRPIGPEAIGEKGIRIRPVSPPSQEDALDAQIYDPIVEGIEDGTLHADATRSGNKVELRLADLPPEQEEPGSEEVDGHWDGLKWKRKTQKSD